MWDMTFPPNLVDNITAPNGVRCGAEFDAAPMRWFGWVGGKKPPIFLLGEAFLDLIRGLLG